MLAPDPWIPVYISLASLALAILALCVSMGGLAWNIYVGWRDQARVAVSVRVTEAMTAGEREIPVLRLEAANRGRRPVWLSGWEIALSDGSTATFSRQHGEAEWPRKLDEGQATGIRISLPLVQQALWRRAPSVWATSFVFRSADGRTFRSKVGRRSKLQGMLMREPDRNDLLGARIFG